MNRNVGSIDRVVRSIAALALFSLFFVFEGSARYLGLIGIVPLATAALGCCPLYRVLGISTCPAR